MYIYPNKTRISSPIQPTKPFSSDFPFALYTIYISIAFQKEKKNCLYILWKKYEGVVVVGKKNLNFKFSRDACVKLDKSARSYYIVISTY